MQHTIDNNNYRSFPAIANSDLSWLEKQAMPKQKIIDCEQAFKFGSLIDAMITESHRVDYYKLRVDGVQYVKADFDQAKLMKAAFMKDKVCQDIIKDCSFQHISYQPEFIVEHEGVKFSVPAKAKWDLKKKQFRFGGDIKSTTATTYEQCLAAVGYFNYDRSRAWYMDLEGHEMDYLIFISKVNFKIFIIPVSSIDHGAKATPGQKAAYELYRVGKLKYQKLAFDYAKLFCEFKTIH
jgi:hypothetical protein